MKDGYGFKVKAGDTILFSYGIPPIGVKAGIECLFITKSDHDQAIAAKDLQIAVLEAQLDKCKEQRNGLCEGYSTHSVVEIKLYDQELDSIEVMK